MRTERRIRTHKRARIFPKPLFGAKQHGRTLAGFGAIIPLGKAHPLIPNTQYTFTLETSGWLPSDSDYEDALKATFENRILVQSVSRGLFSGRYVITLVPSVEGLGINGVAANLVTTMRNLGNESKVVEVNEASSESTQPGGVVQVAKETPAAIGKGIYRVAETVSSAAGGAASGIASGLVKSAWPLLLIAGLGFGGFFIFKDVIVSKFKR